MPSSRCAAPVTGWRPTVVERRHWWPGSVRARTTVAATVVVSLALSLVGVLVVILLSQSLVGSAELRAEINARTIAAQLAAGTTPQRLELPDTDTELAQVVDQSGSVVAAGDELEDEPALAVTAPPDTSDGEVDSSSGSERDDDEDADDHGADSGQDDGDDTDDSSGDAAASDQTSSADDPQAGFVESQMSYSTLTVPELDGRYRFAAIRVTTPDDERLTVLCGASLEDEQRAVDDVTVAMLVTLPLLLIVVAGVTWLVTRRALRPVSAIRAELAEITAGDLSRRVPVPAARDEIHDLAITTNHTLSVLDAAVSQQRRFIADASHELRSPLAILRAQLEVAASHPQLLNLDATVKDVVRLQSLATDLLLLARLDAGERPGQAEVDLTELVREEVARRAATDQIPVALTVEDGLSVLGVRNHLIRVLVNLLDNAQRYADTTVRVDVSRHVDATVRLAVGDDGPGVPIEDREKIFGRFVRLDEARSRDEGGAGLGLAIVRDVVAAHHGTIDVTKSPFGGAQFVVLLPSSDSAAR
jgi:signal transduction histidine kinase